MGKAIVTGGAGFVGSHLADVLYVEDLVAAFDRFLSGGLKHEVFNIGGGQDNTLSLLELLDLLKELTGEVPIVQHSDWRTADQKVYISDIRKASSKLQWKPTITPREGVKRLSNWVKENVNLFT